MRGSSERICQWREYGINCPAKANYYHRNKFKTTEVYQWFCHNHKCPKCQEGV